MHQQPSRQPRQNSSNMQQRGGNVPQQARQQPQQQQQQMAMPNMPMVPPMNQQQFAHVYPYQGNTMYPYAHTLNQYTPQYVTMMPPGTGMMAQAQLPMQIGQQPRFQTPMSLPNRMLQPRQPHVPHQKSRSRAIPIVDPNTLQEVSLVGEVATSEEASGQQVNGEEEVKAEPPVVQENQDSPQLVNGSEAMDKQEDEPCPISSVESDIKTENFVAQEPKTANPTQNPGPEPNPTFDKKTTSKPQRGSKQEGVIQKSPAMTPEPPISSKSPEPSSPIPTPVSSRESPVQEAEDDGDWQEAKVRSKKKKSEVRPMPEKQPERQQQRRKDFDKKVSKGKTPAAGNPKPSLEKTSEAAAAPAPPPVLSYRDKILGKKDVRKTPDSAIEKKSEESEKTDLSPKEEVKAEPAVEVEIVKEEIVKVEPVKKEEEKKPDIELVTVKPADVLVEVVEKEIELEEDKSKDKAKEKTEDIKITSPIEEEQVAVQTENVRSSPVRQVEPKSETAEIKEEAAAPLEVPQIEVVSETPSPEVEAAPVDEPTMSMLLEDKIPSSKLYRSSSMDNLVYAEDQWSPLNTQGKKKYESDFLKKLQNVSVCMKLPENVNLPKNIVREANREFSRPIGGGSGFSYGKENSLMPSFATFSPKRDPRRMHDGTPKIVKSISLSADVKLNESENAWKPNKRLKDETDTDKSDTEELLKKVRSILNKITPEKFDKLMGQVKEMRIDTMEKLEGVINLVFLKAIDEPSFSHVYAKMCHDLSTYVRLRTDEEGQTVISFKRLLILRCQQEYERQNQEDDIKEKEEELKKIEEAEGDEKKELTLRMEEKYRKKRVRYVGVNRFIAELYQRELLKPAIMLRCIQELLADQSEECLECLCKIVTTIGQDLEEKNISLKEPIDKVNELVVKKATSTRIRFMMQDVVELRGNRWKPRREAVKPKTMEEIAQEAKKEAAAVPPSSSISQSTPNHRGGTPGRGQDRGGDKMNRSAPRPSKPVVFDAKKLSGMTMDSEVSLGRPSFGQWQSGSGVPKSKNMFMVLDDEKAGDLDGPNNNYSKSKQQPRM